MTPDLWPKTADLIRRTVFLRPGLRLALILAVALFALVIGICSALVEIATITRLEVNAALSRGQLASYLVVSQLGQAMQNSPGTSPREIIARDERVGGTMDDARALIPGVVEVLIADTANVVIRTTKPELAGQALPPGKALIPGRGLGLLTQGLSLMKANDPFEVSVDFELDGRRFGTVRALMAPSLMREGLRQVIMIHLLKLSLQVLLATLFAIAVSWLVVVRPLGRIGAGLDRLQRGEYDARLDVKDTDEMGHLARQVNAISEIMAAEREAFVLQRDEGDTLRRLVDAVDDGIIMIDANQVVRMANRQAASMLGFESGALVGRDLDSVLPPGSPLIPAVRAAFTGEMRSGTSLIELPSPAGPRMLLVTCQLAGDGGAGEGAMITLRDYGRVQRIREVLDHARVLSQLGRMAAGVAHEVRNPLAAMNIHLHLLKDKLPGSNGSDQGRHHVKVVQDEIARLERVVSGFLRLARLDQLSLSRIDVGRFLDNLVELVQPEARMAGVDILVRVDSGVSDLYADEEVLRQAFLNLIRNAIQASPAGSEPITLAASPDTNQVCITVIDHGRGMPEEVLNKAFDLYFTTRKEGSGVGLALVQQAVEMHGGRVEVDSVPGQGTKFTVCIPAVDGS